MRQLITIVILIAGCFSVSGQADFYNVKTIQEIKISFTANNWKYLLDSLRFNGEELLNGKVNINGQDLASVGVRYRDGRSFTPNGKRNGLVLDLGAKDYQGHHIVDLSSALRDPSLVREVLAAEIAGTYFQTPRANYAKVYINEEYYGLFVNVEAVESGFLKRAFGNDTGNLLFANPELGNTPPDGCSSKTFGSLQYEKRSACVDHNFDVRQGNYGKLLDLTSELAMGGNRLEQFLDVDAALWMLAFNNVLVNLNSYTGQYANNYYLYQNADGRMVPLLGELNLAFGSFKNDGVTPSDLSTPDLLMLSPDLHRTNKERPLISSLLSNESYYKQYLSHLRTILVEWVMSGKLESRAKELQNIIRSSVTMDTGNYYSAAEFNQSLTEVIGTRSRIPGLVDFMRKRAAWLESQEVYTVLPPTITEIGVEGRERFSSTLLQEFRVHAKVGDFAKKAFVYYRFSPGENFRVLEMMDDGEHYDGKAGDTVFGAVIQPGDGQTQLQYYIAAENAKALSFNPSHYNFEQFQTSLSEVNK